MFYDFYPTMHHDKGRTPDVFISENFIKVGEKNARAKCWNMVCNYCPAGTAAIKHRDMIATPYKTKELPKCLTVDEELTNIGSEKGRSRETWDEVGLLESLGVRSS
jgi:hypothetical protein